MDARTLHFGIAAFAFVGAIATGGIVLCALNGMDPQDVLGNIAAGCVTGIGTLFVGFVRSARRVEDEDSHYPGKTKHSG